MKTFFNRKHLKNLSLLLFAMLLFSAAFTSCKKDKTDYKAFVMVTNSAQASAPQDFYVDGVKATSSAVAYGESSNFLEVKAGEPEGAFKSSGTSTTNVSFDLQLANNFYYDIFYTDNNSYTVAPVDRSAPPSDKAKVRFINLSSAVVSNVDFGIDGGDKLVSALGYTVASAYYNVDPSKTFAVYTSGSASVLLSIPATLQAGHIYTVYLSGATSATLTFHTIAEN